MFFLLACALQCEHDDASLQGAKGELCKMNTYVLSLLHTDELLNIPTSKV